MTPLLFLLLSLLPRLPIPLHTPLQLMQRPHLPTPRDNHLKNIPHLTIIIIPHPRNRPRLPHINLSILRQHPLVNYRPSETRICMSYLQRHYTPWQRSGGTRSTGGVIRSHFGADSRAIEEQNA